MVKALFSFIVVSLVTAAVAAPTPGAFLSVLKTSHQLAEAPRDNDSMQQASSPPELPESYYLHSSSSDESDGSLTSRQKPRYRQVPRVNKLDLRVVNLNTKQEEQHDTTKHLSFPTALHPQEQAQAFHEVRRESLPTDEYLRKSRNMGYMYDGANYLAQKGGVIVDGEGHLYSHGKTAEQALARHDEGAAKKHWVDETGLVHLDRSKLEEEKLKKRIERKQYLGNRRDQYI